MLKKLLVAVGVIFGVIAVLLIAAGVIVYLKVDKAFIASHMSQALNRQVSIEKIDISVFSVLSGVEVRNVVVSNFKTPPELANLQGKPVAPADVFASMAALHFKLKILPLLGRRVELKELVLLSPVINLSRDKQGVMNIDDLIKSRKPADKDKKESPAKEPARPLSADDLPVAIAVGEIGMKNGTINYYDGEYDQKIQIYKLTALAYDIAVDPRNLAERDEIKIKLDLGVKTIGALTSGSVESFDVSLRAAGRVIPFDSKTRLLEPEAILHVAVPEGEVTGLQLFGAVAAVPVLGDYLGEHLAFLKG
ncbi:MAG: AsmA family protein, partial [Deltaproteobacteria bacterium]|nr:AsmA family protein [Deltaproteobacteria bacterium]